MINSHIKSKSKRQIMERVTIILEGETTCCEVSKWIGILVSFCPA